MSTRCQVIAIKGEQKCYTYHHCDGYPEGVGSELLSWLQLNENNLPGNPKLDLTNPNTFLQSLEDFDSSYEFENYGLHGDEEYVYYVDLEKRTFKCYHLSQFKDGTKCPFDGPDGWWDYPEEKIEENKYLCMDSTF